MVLNLNRKIALVTGASRGICASIATAVTTAFAGAEGDVT